MQVYCNGRLVGRLNVKPYPGARFHEIQVYDAPAFNFRAPGPEDISMQTVTSRRIRLEIMPRTVAISDFDLMMSEGTALFAALKAHSIPADYRQVKDMERQCTLLKWNVLEATPEVYEEIFDLKEFEVDDSYDQPDLEARERRRADLANYEYLTGQPYRHR